MKRNEETSVGKERRDAAVGKLARSIRLRTSERLLYACVHSLLSFFVVCVRVSLAFDAFHTAAPNTNNNTNNVSEDDPKKD